MFRLAFELIKDPIVQSIIVYLILLLFKNKMGFLMYELAVATVYLISLSIEQTLDITLPVYIIFSVFPYIMSFQINSLFSVVFMMYFSTSLLLSIMFNGIWEPLSMFVIKLSGIIFFFYIFSNIEYKDERRTHILIISVVSEIILTIACITLTTEIKYHLMVNYQCTVGCISTGFMLLATYDYCITKKKSTFIIMLFYTFMTCISGTRGYILICSVILFTTIILYFDIKTKLLIFPIVMTEVILKSKYVFGQIDKVLRLTDGLGIRTAENKYIIKFMQRRPLFNILFGNGYGPNVNKFSESYDVIAEVVNDPWQFWKFYNKLDFHNFWLANLYMVGVVGLILLIILFIYICINVWDSPAEMKFKIILLSFVMSYAVMLWYRWSATSGILEFAIFAYILGNIKARKEKEVDEPLIL